MRFKIKIYLLLLSILPFAANAQPGRLKNRNISSPATNSIKDSNALRIVSTPNPSVFPLLLAIAEKAKIPVELIPVGTQKEAEEKLVNGEADGIIGMSYMAAKLKAGKVPDLEMKSIVYWSGFFEVTQPGIKNLAELKGKHLIVSGPVGTGQNGGPDIFFQAAVKQAGLLMSDFTIEYLPVKEGTEKVAKAEADAILLAEPAASGMVMMAGMKQGKDLVKGINFQNIFGSYQSWKADELPLGGLSIKSSALENPLKKENAALLIKVYEEKANAIMKGTMMTGRRISQQLDKYYGSLLPQKLPGMIINKAIKEGTLKYHSIERTEFFSYEMDLFIGKIIY